MMGPLHEKRVLITGGTGSLGKTLLRRCLSGAAGEPMYRLLSEAFEQTRRLVCAIHDVDDLLDRDPVLQRNIRLRNPYVDPMNLVQVDFLSRWRAGGREDDTLLEVLMTTVRGIARGMQNTG